MNSLGTLDFLSIVSEYNTFLRMEQHNKNGREKYLLESLVEDVVTVLKRYGIAI